MEDGEIHSSTANICFTYCSVVRFSRSPNTTFDYCMLWVLLVMRTNFPTLAIRTNDIQNRSIFQNNEHRTETFTWDRDKKNRWFSNIIHSYRPFLCTYASRIYVTIYTTVQLVGKDRKHNRNELCIKKSTTNQPMFDWSL